MQRAIFFGRGSAGYLCKKSESATLLPMVLARLEAPIGVLS